MALAEPMSLIFLALTMSVILLAKLNLNPGLIASVIQRCDTHSRNIHLTTLRQTKFWEVSARTQFAYRSHTN
ncbi:MAG: hypothetical protein EA001_05570 [Oscillatoriales cyanobacterium]|nr:MAG: hypothetical protein EA001_05570 [Oscillatoriales cyanobacterium]